MPGALGAKISRLFPTDSAYSMTNRPTFLGLANCRPQKGADRPETKCQMAQTCSNCLDDRKVTFTIRIISYLPFHGPLIKCV